MFNIGQKVKCVSTSLDTQNFGRATALLRKINIGEEYTVNKIEQHSWHTLIWLDGFENSFNDALFESID